MYLKQQVEQKGFLVTGDIKKPLDSVDHFFLLAVLQKYGFWECVLKWIQVLIKNKESCVVNGGVTTKFCSLYGGTRQGDPISAFLLILALEVSFVLIKPNSNIIGLDIYGRTFLYTAYADDSSFFFKNKKSVIEAFKIFGDCSIFPGLKPSKEKCEVAGVDVKKGVKVTLCGIKNIDLKKNTAKILGVHYSYIKKLENEKNFKNHIQKIETIFKNWRMRNLTLEGKITVFKTLAISKTIRLGLVTVLPNSKITS